MKIVSYFIVPSFSADKNFVRDRLQILPLILSEFKQFNQLLFPMKLW